MLINERLTNEIHDSFCQCHAADGLPSAITVWARHGRPQRSDTENDRRDGHSDRQARGDGATSDGCHPSEIRATVQLYLDGKIREWYSRGDGKGIIFLIDAKSEDEARAIMETLPLAKLQLMDEQYIPVGPLMPLRALVGPGSQE